jgi:hypothetical protein
VRVPAPSIRDNDELWEQIGELENSLRAGGSELDADRLHRAVTISAHPGDVWPETLVAIRDLLARRPPGLDEETASACADYLSRWP